jgi:hypothetical protein
MACAGLPRNLSRGKLGMPRKRIGHGFPLLRDGSRRGCRRRRRIALCARFRCGWHAGLARPGTASPAQKLGLAGVFHAMPVIEPARARQHRACRFALFVIGQPAPALKIGGGHCHKKDGILWRSRMARACPVRLLAHCASSKMSPRMSALWISSAVGCRGGRMVHPLRVW